MKARSSLPVGPLPQAVSRSGEQIGAAVVGARVAVRAARVVVGRVAQRAAAVVGARVAVRTAPVVVGRVGCVSPIAPPPPLLAASADVPPEPADPPAAPPVPDCEAPAAF